MASSNSKPAIIRKEQRDIADLGPVEIIEESFKIFWIYPKTWLLILSTFILPVAILGQLFLYFRKPFASTSNHSLTGHIFHPHNGSGSFKFDGLAFSSVLGVMALVGIGTALQIIQCLSTSTILYAVGLIYSGKTVSFHDVIRAAIPRLWLRLSVTTLYTTLIVYFLAMIQLVVFILLVSLQANVYVLVLSRISLMLFLVVAGISLGMTVIGASGESVWEKAYGWAAIAKGYRLLQGKKWDVFWFSMLVFMPGLLIGFFQRYLLPSGPQDQGDVSAWDWAKLVTSMVIFTACSSIYQLFATLCNGVMYVSCKAFHNESIEDSSLFGERARRSAYEHIEDLPA